MTQNRIPIYGSFSRPANPDEGLKELTNGLLNWQGGNITIEFETKEFTAVCPTTGQPDFYSIHISYVPNHKYIESKCMKFYLWSFRDYGIHAEYLADKIANDLYLAISPKSIEVKCEQFPRGGLGLVATARK